MSEMGAPAAEAVGRVTVDDVLHVAELANLELTADEVPRMQRDLNAVLGYIAQLNELDTTRVPETDGSSLRADEVKPSVDRKAVMASAPESDGRFFKVPKVIER